MSNVIIVGCGRVGSEVANMLSDNNNNVSVIESNPENFRRLGQNFNGNTIIGVGFDEDTLKRAGVEDSDIVLAVTDNDNTNLMVCEVCNHIFNIDHVVARLHNLNHETSYMQLGIDYVCGTRLVTEQLYSKVILDYGAHEISFGEYDILKFSLDLTWCEKDSIPIQDIENSFVRIVAIERADTGKSSIPSSKTILNNGDSIMACVHTSYLDKFKKFILE